MKLSIELVPQSCWFSNVRDHVTKNQWRMIRDSVAHLAHYSCEICGGAGPRWPVECHEVWEYDDVNLTQTLVKLQALCPDCHEVKHIGLAFVKGRGERALAHLATVNHISVGEARELAESALEVWRVRSQKEWVLDLSYLKRVFGIKVEPRRAVGV